MGRLAQRSGSSKRGFEATRVEPGAPQVKNTAGEDIGPALAAAAKAVELPLWYVLACAIAESGLNQYAERWGSQTAAAKAATIAAANRGDIAALEPIVRAAGADVSFGFGQQTVQLFYGAAPYKVADCLALRQRSFNEPAWNITDMCQRIRGHMDRAQTSGQLWRVNGDLYLAGLLGYNSGVGWHEQWYWDRYGGNVASYKAAISRAKAMVGEA